MKKENKLLKAINAFSRGTLIGIVICLIFNFAYKTENFNILSSDLMLTYGANVSMLILILFSGSISLVASLTGGLLKNENRSLFMNTLIHFVLMQVVIALFVIVFNLIDLYLAFFVISTIIYLIIWFVVYSSIQKEIHSINENLKTRQ